MDFINGLLANDPTDSMQLSNQNAHWNELEFLSWKQFKQMAPSIIQLEISRTGGMINAPASHIDIRNVLVRTRFELQRFQECLQRADRPPLADSCVAHLRTAILSLSLQSQIQDKAVERTVKYICDRLKSVLRRIDLIFQYS